MIDPSIKDKIVKAIEEEAERIEFGKLHVEILVKDKKCVGLKIETERNYQLTN